MNTLDERHAAVMASLERLHAEKHAAEAKGDITYQVTFLEIDEDGEEMGFESWTSRDLDQVLAEIGKGSPEGTPAISISTVYKGLHEEIERYTVEDGYLRRCVR